MLHPYEFRKLTVAQSLRNKGGNLARIANGTEAILDEILKDALKMSTLEIYIHAYQLCDALNIPYELSGTASAFASILLQEYQYKFCIDSNDMIYIDLRDVMKDIANIPSTYNVDKPIIPRLTQRQIKLLQYLNRYTSMEYVATDMHGNVFLFEQKPTEKQGTFEMNLMCNRHICLNDASLYRFLHTAPCHPERVFAGISLEKAIPPHVIFSIEDL